LKFFVLKLHSLNAKVESVKLLYHKNMIIEFIIKL